MDQEEVQGIVSPDQEEMIGQEGKVQEAAEAQIVQEVIIEIPIEEVLETQIEVHTVKVHQEDLQLPEDKIDLQDQEDNSKFFLNKYL